MSLRNIIKAALVFTLSVVLIVAIGLVGMLSFTAVTFFQDRKDTASMLDIDAALVERDSAYTFETPALLKDNHRWAMLISADGNILWSQDLPKDVPLHYELADVASFTRWYLEDYPVTTRIRDDGILVVGAPKGSQWKQLLVFSMQNLSVMPYWFVGCVCFMLIAVLGTSALLLRHWFRKDQERRDAARANLIHNISHDIRTPLAIVMGKAGQLENDPRLPVDARKDATIICNQSQTFAIWWVTLTSLCVSIAPCSPCALSYSSRKPSCAKQRQIFSIAAWQRAILLKSIFPTRQWPP